jgi:hypothetical protein
MNWIRRAILVFALSLGCSPAMAADAQKPDSGAYAASPASDVLPPDFRGRISYRGTHQGQVNHAGPPLRSLRIGDIVRSATGGRTEQHAGAYELELSFDGRAVSGRYSGTGGLPSGTLSGTRDGSSCRLVDDRYGSVIDAECTRSRFIGESRTQRGRDTTNIRLEADAVTFVDAAEEERLEMERRASADAERQAAMRASPPPATRQSPSAAGSGVRHADGSLILTTAALGISLDELLNRLVTVDARTWHFNHYVPGSIRNARYETTNRGHTTFVAHGTYSYVQGSGGPQLEGWARVWIRDGRFGCIQFHDESDPDMCRPLNAGLSQQFFTGLIQDMMNMNLQESGISGICARVRLVQGMPVMRPVQC